jgi:hypothetical protein
MICLLGVGELHYVTHGQNSVGNFHYSWNNLWKRWESTTCVSSNLHDRFPNFIILIALVGWGMLTYHAGQWWTVFKSTISIVMAATLVWVIVTVCKLGHVKFRLK